MVLTHVFCGLIEIRNIGSVNFVDIILLLLSLLLFLGLFGFTIFRQRFWNLSATCGGLWTFER